MRASLFVLAGLALTPFTASASSFTTIDLSSYVNSNVAINPGTFPTGNSSGNQGTGIPFLIAQYPASSGVEGTWNSGGNPGTTLTVTLPSGITGQASFYALLNNYYGTPGADEYDVTINASNGDTVTYQSIGGVDTRDYNNSFYSNTFAASTTPWFDNGIGQRLDVREFTLPTSFAADTITSFVIDQVHVTDAALLTGLTFSQAGVVSFVPEPAGLAALGAGLAGLVLVRRRRA